MSNSQKAIAAAIKLLELEGYTITRPASPQAWDYTLIRKYAPAAKGSEILQPALRDL